MLPNKEQIFTMYLMIGMLLLPLDGNASHPGKHCDSHDRLVALLVGYPHYERQALVLRDELPSQGHLLELFMNSGEHSRHSYTLIRTREHDGKACIVSAGLVHDKKIDNRDCENLSLADENHPDIYNVMICQSVCNITRTFIEGDVSEKMFELYGSKSLVAAYGQILENNLMSISWPKD